MGSRGATAAVKAELAGRVVAPILFAEIVWQSGVTHVWSGIGDLTWTGETWAGVGEFGGISPIEETLEIRAAGIELWLDGIDAGLLALVLADSSQGDTVKVWLGFLDNAGAIVLDPLLVFSGWVDQPVIDQTAAGGRIAVKAESELIDLKRPRLRRYSDQDQQLLWPGDLFFEFVAELGEREVKWQ